MVGAGAVVTTGVVGTVTAGAVVVVATVGAVVVEPPEPPDGVVVVVVAGRTVVVVVVPARTVVVVAEPARTVVVVAELPDPLPDPLPVGRPSIVPDESSVNCESRHDPGDVGAAPRWVATASASTSRPAGVGWIPSSFNTSG